MPLWSAMFLAEKYGRLTLTLDEVAEQIGLSPDTIRQRSPEAASLYSGAMRFVDEVNRDRWGGLMPTQDQADVARQYIGATAQRRMMEDLEPIHRALAKHAALTIGPEPPVPAEIQALIDSIKGRWQGAVRELLG